MNVSPYALWLKERVKTHHYPRSTTEAKRAGAPLHQWRACPTHLIESGAHACAAKRLQRRLKALGYYAGQYQGYVTTDAPHETVKEKLA